MYMFPTPHTLDALRPRTDVQDSLAAEIAEIRRLQIAATPEPRRARPARRSALTLLLGR